MNVPKSPLLRVAVGAMTAAPLLLLGAMFLLLFLAPNYDFSWLVPAFLWSLPVFVATILYYLILIATSSPQSGQTALWALALLASSPLAGPAFWVIYFRRSPRTPSGASHVAAA